MRPLSSDFQLLVLPRSHGLKIILLLSTGRLSCSRSLSSPAGRMYSARLHSAHPGSARGDGPVFYHQCFLSDRVHRYLLEFLEIVFAGPLPYKLALILVSGEARNMFQLQGIILEHSGKRLRRIQTLITANFPPPETGSAQ